MEEKQSRSLKKNTKKRKPLKTKQSSKKRQKEILDSSETNVDSEVESDTDDSIKGWDALCQNVNKYDIQNSDNDQELPCKDKPHQTHEMSSIRDEYEPSTSRRNPQVDDWLLIKFATKKTLLELLYQWIVITQK